MESMWNPEVIVGIDFGMTCSGIAYSMAPGWPDPRTIQNWPGKLGYEIRNKVRTSVSYDIQSGSVATWGFLCNASDDEDDGRECNQLFKLLLDPNYKDASGIPTADARRWYRDYLSCLYRFVIQHFSEIIPKFARKQVEFVFSVPVTWRFNPTILTQIEGLIRSAGFGQNERERASIYLSEAEAAAIYASKQGMEKGDVYLVCDAGGGTTDLNVLRVESASKAKTVLTPLSWTEGDTVGSTLIDYRIRRIVKQRLAAIEHTLQGTLDSNVSQMMKDKFEGFKCSFGTAGMDVPKLPLPIPGLAGRAGMSFPQLGIEDSKLNITRDELRAVFDDQVNKMCDLIDKQISLVEQNHARETISYLVLSGGLGSSIYVQNRIRQRYEQGAGGRFACIEGLQVLVAPSPQLAVAHGLVLARMQASRGGPDFMPIRVSPISVGILSREAYFFLLPSCGGDADGLRRYDPVKHQGELLVSDPHDGSRWAERQINWVLVQGQEVGANTGASFRFQIKLAMGQERSAWKTTIVMSTLPAAQLPRSMKQAGAAKQLCSIESVLQPQDMKRMNRRFYHLRKEYNLAEFEIRLFIETGLKFEIWGKDGVRSQSHDEIPIQWESA